ncbi:DUF805 domain-containing protein [Kribbella antibiotica]|uniref:DUF805 domain-containing protein n=1 Tax=Kribbella antibiotica TaxID=190195 RepID=A0A4R4ZN63_9ACTN|nr:DUF805 domain-containing protein [Kribbella antibiotica]TDD60273.1 DUF805 domain-containing protein [Kribbella antibiotica]
MQSILVPFKKYAVFTGRARRKEFWLFTLGTLVVLTVLSLLDQALDTPGDDLGLLSGIFLLLILVPNLAVTVRRFHDADRNAAWLLLWLIPFFGQAATLLLNLQKGTDGGNRFGPDPKTI